MNLCRAAVLIGISICVVLFIISPTNTPLKVSLWKATTFYGAICKPLNSDHLQCIKLFKNNLSFINSSKHWKPQKTLSDEKLVNLSSDCNLLRQKFCFPTLPLTSEEAKFPLAFAILVYNDNEQFIRMLQSFYWPQNLYCITYDTKSKRKLHILVENLAKCFPNIVMPKEHICVVYNEFGVLNAIMNCMKTLSSANHKWKYVQILSGHDIALKTNREMVKILKVLNGSLDSSLTKAYPGRWEKKKKPPPNNLTIYKSGFAATLSRKFIDFIVKDPISIEYFNWLNGTRNPDEQYWSTLISNTIVNAPGCFPGNCLRYGQKCSISRYQIWSDGKNRQCKGKFVHDSCVFGVGDLATLIKQHHLVAHKVYMNFEPSTFYCMLE